MKYRGRTYDLSPLTREALTRPIENDIRYALQRVPGSAAHLEAMASELRASRVYAILSSVFLVGFVVLRPQRMPGEREQAKRNVLSAATGSFLLSSLFLSLRSSRKAKEELVDAVREFNAHSPYPIEPAGPGDLNE